jgi:hypothetical protein
VAEGGIFEPSADQLSPSDRLVEFRQFPFGYLAQPVGCSIVARRRLEEKADLVEGEAGALCRFDDGERAEDFRLVAAATASPFGWRNEPDLL